MYFRKNNQLTFSRLWSHGPKISACRRMKREDYNSFRSSLDYIQGNNLANQGYMVRFCLKSS